MERVKIMQHGRVVGTIPRPEGQPPNTIYTAFRPERNGDPMATIRTTDFRTEMFVTDDGWRREVRLVASPMLGFGDLQDIKGFEPVSQ